MRRFLGSLVIVALALQNSAAIAKSTASPRALGKSETIAGSDVLVAYAATCSDSSWKKFASWARAMQLHDQSWKVSTHTLKGESEFSFPRGSVTRTASGGFNARIDGKTYSGTDACDLANKIRTDSTSVSLIERLLLADAKAEPTVKEPETLLEWGLLGTAGLIAGGCAVGTALVGSVVCGLVGTGFYWVMKNALFPVKLAVAELVNQPFKLVCDDKTVTLEGAKHKLEITRQFGRRKVEQLKLYPVNKKDQVIFNEALWQETPAVAKFVTDLAKRCKNIDDARELMLEHKRGLEQVQTRVAAYTAGDDSTAAGASKRARTAP